MERTISGMIGKGSVNHNTRAFTAQNVDKERSSNNIQFCHTDIKQVYHELFDEALERYNAKQTRKDRRIDDYYEKIRSGKQEKTFHEVIFQIGNKDDMNARNEEGQLAKEILCEFMENFQSRNPNLYVFSAHLHMDEETPHLHIDFVPFTRGSKRGLDTRVSLKKALAAQGFEGGKRGATEWNEWMESEKEALSRVMQRHGVKWKQLGTHNKHLLVLDYEKQERTKEVVVLESRIEIKEKLLRDTTILTDQESEKKQALEKEVESLENQKQTSENEKKKLEKEIKSMAVKKDILERDVRVYDEDDEWQLEAPGLLTTAKTYFDKIASPLVSKLKKRIKSLTIKYVNLQSRFERLQAKVKKQDSDIAWYCEKLQNNDIVISHLKEKADDLDRVKRYVGTERVQEIIDTTKDIDRRNQALMQSQRSKSRGMSR